jgi:hypothetical protein
MHCDFPIHPSTLENNHTDRDIEGYNGTKIAPGFCEVYTGITIRQHFASLAMQALITRGSFSESPISGTLVAEMASYYADELINKLTELEDEDTADTSDNDNDGDGDKAGAAGTGIPEITPNS